MVSGLQRSPVLSDHSLCQLRPRAVSHAGLHCSTCMYDLQVMITSSVHTSYRHLDNTRMCLGNTRALLHAVTAKTFFILKTHNPLRVVEHVRASGPPLEQESRVRSRGTCGSIGALLNREAGGTWQHRSPPKQRDGVWTRGTRGSTEALPSREAGSETVWHVAAPKPSRAGRRDPEPWDTWQHRSPPE
jgi:hypothetical protein